MRYAALAAGCLALVAVLGGYWALRSPPKPVTVTRVVKVPVGIKTLSNYQLVNQLGRPVVGIDCKKLLGVAGLVGALWADNENKRYVIICVPGTAS